MVQVGPNAGDVLVSKGELTLPLASFAAITAWDNHVAALVPSASGMTAGSASLAGDTLAIAQSAPLGSGVVNGAALTTVGDHLLVLSGSNGAFSLIKVPGAKAALNFGQSEAEDFNPTNLSQLSGAFDGTHVAIAAARARVLVVWLTSAKLGTGSETGGWAMLQCAE